MLFVTNFNLYSECLTKEALEGSGDFKIGGQIINTVKYADDVVLLAKEETVLQDTIDKLTEIGRCYGMEKNVEKHRSDENFKTTISNKTYYRPKNKTTGELGFFKYLGSMLANNVRCTCEIKSRIALAKAAFNKNRILFTSKWT
jgi:hypothetical protein